MRLLHYGTGLMIAAALFVMVPAARADIAIGFYVTDGTTTYSTPGLVAGSDASIPDFTLDGVTFRGVNAFELTGPTSVNFSASLSGVQTAGTTISYFVEDFSSQAFTSFNTTAGLTLGVVGGTFTAESAVISNGGPFVVGPLITVPFSATSAQSATSTYTTVTPGAPTEILMGGTITSFHMDGGAPTFSATTNLVVPEPTGVLIGVLGLPCMGAVVFLSRRRPATMAAAA